MSRGWSGVARRGAKWVIDSAGLRLGDPAATTRNTMGPKTPMVVAALEALALLIALTGLEWAFWGPGAYASWVAHPFWLPVALASLQYGSSGGVTAALLAIAFHHAPSETPGEGYFAHVVSASALPIAWLSAAVLVGQFRNIQIERERRIDESRRRWRGRAIDFQAEIGRLDARIAEFELQRLLEAEGERRDVLSTLDALRRAPPGELVARLREAARYLCGDARFRVFLRRGNREFVESLEQRRDAPPPQLRPPLIAALRGRHGALDAGALRTALALAGATLEASEQSIGWAIGVAEPASDRLAMALALEFDDPEPPRHAETSIELLADACAVALRRAQIRSPSRLLRAAAPAAQVGADESLGGAP